MGRRRSGEARERLLEAGLELLVELRTAEKLKGPTVAKRAGLTPGAFYNYWGSREEFIADLLDYAYRPEHYTTPELLEAKLAELLPTGVAFQNLIAELARFDLATVSSDPMLYVQLSSWVQHKSDPVAAARLRELYDRFVERLMPIEKRLLTTIDREPRPPFTLRKIAVGLNALAEGLALQRALDPEAFDAEYGDLFGWLVLALLPSMTRPVGDTQHLGEVVEGEGLSREHGFLDDVVASEPRAGEV